MAASSREHVLSLYRLLLKESKKFPSYNYRTYALRRVRDAFRENRTVEDPKVVEELVKRARDGLALIQRQFCRPLSPSCCHLLCGWSVFDYRRMQSCF
uniref:LYR motif containing 4 n=1 Tax=Cyprinus carpio carpio TaxID=630221 RepID=A0A9J7Y422_CYPCA